MQEIAAYRDLKDPSSEYLSRNRSIFKSVVESNIKRKGIKDLMNYIDSTDFFSAPASTRFHSPYSGGLCFHSLCVYSVLKKLVDLHNLYISLETVTLVSLFHDLCKINCYQRSSRNVKDNSTGKWTTVPYWSFNDSFPAGHGEKSVFIISDYLRITKEEKLAIRWHMLFSNITSIDASLNAALNQTPLVILTANADHQASVLYEWEPDKKFEPCSCFID